MPDLTAWQARVVTELRDLERKIAALTAFEMGETFNSLPLVERELLSRQLAAMQDYAQALRERTARFE